MSNDKGNTYITLNNTQLESEEAEHLVPEDLIKGVLIERGQYISYKLLTQRKEKEIIAERAMKYIENFQSVLLDAGSTVELVAERMFREKEFLTVLTNNMGVYVQFFQGGRKNLTAQNNKLIISGGEYFEVFESLLGQGARDSIEKFRPNVTIIGTSGIKSDEGIFCHGAEESAIKLLMCQRPTDTLLIVTDWTKIGKADAYAFRKIPELFECAGKVIIVTNAPDRKYYGMSKADIAADKALKNIVNMIKKFDKEKDLLIAQGIVFDDGTLSEEP